MGNKLVDVRYCVAGAGPVGHPQLIFERIAEQQGWKVVKETPHVLENCWVFSVEADEYSLSSNTDLGLLPTYIEILEAT